MQHNLPCPIMIGRFPSRVSGPRSYSPDSGTGFANKQNWTENPPELLARLTLQTRSAFVSRVFPTSGDADFRYRPLDGETMSRGKLM
jgi:hypothetical protein